jgi:hypothetical protein
MLAHSRLVCEVISQLKLRLQHGVAFHGHTTTYIMLSTDNLGVSGFGRQNVTSNDQDATISFIRTYHPIIVFPSLWAMQCSEEPVSLTLPSPTTKLEIGKQD